MSLYYDGDLDADLKKLEGIEAAKLLDEVGAAIGYGRAQQILQVLWARKLREKEIPTSGALYR